MGGWSAKEGASEEMIVFRRSSDGYAFSATVNVQVLR